MTPSAPMTGDIPSGRITVIQSQDPFVWSKTVSVVIVAEKPSVARDIAQVVAHEHGRLAGCTVMNMWLRGPLGTSWDWHSHTR